MDEDDFDQRAARQDWTLDAPRHRRTRARGHRTGQKRLTGREFKLLTAQVAADVDAGVWTVLPVTAAIVEAQTRRMAGLPANVFLRAADALHLASAAEAGLTKIYSSDRHLCAAASHFGLKAVTL